MKPKDETDFWRRLAALLIVSAGGQIEFPPEAIEEGSRGLKLTVIRDPIKQVVRIVVSKVTDPDEMPSGLVTPDGAMVPCQKRPM